MRARALMALAFAMALALPAGNVDAGVMYVCRDKSGAMNFTNAPTGGSCREYALSAPTVFQGTIGGAFSRSSGDSSAYDAEIRKVARRYGIDPSLIKAIIQAESDFDHRAVSSKGAQGLMQLMPETSRELNVLNPFNPRENIDGGTRYLRQLLDSFNGNLSLSLAAYNAGPGLVSRTGGIPDIPETRNYVVKVMRQYKEYKKRNGLLLARE
jgi:soluble lytic murein transglycosylase-like protein